MSVDQDIVVQNLRVVRGDKAHPSHIGGQAIDLIHSPGSLQAVSPQTQVQQFELVGAGLAKFGVLDVHPTHPVAFIFEIIDQVIADEATGACD